MLYIAGLLYDDDIARFQIDVLLRALTLDDFVPVELQALFAADDDDILFVREILEPACIYQGVHNAGWHDERKRSRLHHFPVDRELPAIDRKDFDIHLRATE